MQDTYDEAPDGEAIEERLERYTALILAAPPDGPYTEVVRLLHGAAASEERIIAAVERLEQRRDCADFALNGLLPLMYRFGSSELLKPQLRSRVKKAIIDFKYWPDEPGTDSMCTWTENHQIMFAAGGYLAGQLYPQEVFTSSGETGRRKMEICRPRIARWLDLRFRTGFSEWLSNVYYDEDFPPLLNLVQYCDDQDIAERSRMVVDLMLLDLVMNQHRGTLGSTHGRCYERQKKSGHHESTGSVLKLLFGVNALRPGNMSAVSFLLADRYRLPEVLGRISEDASSRELVSRQRVGIRLRERRRWGLAGRDTEIAMVLLSLEAYADPRTIRGTLRLLDRFGWWENEFYRPFARHRRFIDAARRTGLIRPVARLWKRDLTRNTREEANIYTYRTPEVMLSSAQDYRKGYGGDQQHIWQATLGPEAVVFTTHPATPERETGGSSQTATPNYWTGSGTLPRVGQYRNVLVALYRVPRRQGLYLTCGIEMTHAWFPRDRFDEVIEQSGWVFGRRGEGYVAHWSRAAVSWALDDGRPAELVAQGKENIWICEVGHASAHGSFRRFVSLVSCAKVEHRGLTVRYYSPSCGRVRFGWRGPLRVEGKRIGLRGYPRYGSPYAAVPFPAERVELRHGDAWLTLDWLGRKRTSSGYLGSKQNLRPPVGEPNR